ncbi:DUF1993 domain-containing protein [Mesorhizobium koreense]|jgi:hypothetical protein|uniref:DUF1993 domain-containing protein n=1 Tax=Mesorhizobium koreense TaxID=3074855 RepID=UPI00287B9FF4|nr:DUF1993 domain-containing protein [Mesorhizobium sp. WR6]
MTISMYSASVPVFSSMLKNLSHVLAKGEANAAQRKIEPAVFLNDRLAPDMLTLTAQVQIATDHAKGACARLSGRDPLKLEDKETSFTELQARIGKVQDYLKTFSPADIDGSEEKEIALKLGGGEMKFPGMQYLLHFATPNFYFHVTTAYAILRHNGVPLGKTDFFGRG